MVEAATARRYGGLDADERRSVRRQRLLDAGLARFAADGFAATTIEGLCAAAGVTPRHFYEQFPTKEALLREVYDGVIGDALQAVADALAAADDADDAADAQIRGGLAAFLHAYLDDPRRGRIACIEVVGVSADLERHRRAALHAFADLVAAQAAHLGAGAIDPLHPLALVGGTNEMVIEWLVTTEPTAPGGIDRLVDALTALYQAVWRPVSR